MPSLAHLLGTKEEDLPCIYLLHPTSQQVLKYPRKFDEKSYYTPELLIAWAERTQIEMNTFDVVLPQLLKKRKYKEAIDMLLEHNSGY